MEDRSKSYCSQAREWPVKSRFLAPPGMTGSSRNPWPITFLATLPVLCAVRPTGLGDTRCGRLRAEPHVRWSARLPWNPSIEIGLRVADQSLHRLQVRPERVDAFIPRGGARWNF